MLKVFAVFDVKASCFGKPFVLATNGLAMRGFVDVCRDKKCPFVAYPSEYSLWELGTYDPNTGVLVSLAKPMQIMSASQAIEEGLTKGAVLED